jgi:Tol biopolymer transport system component
MTRRGGIRCGPVRRAQRASSIVASAGLLLAGGAAAGARWEVGVGGSPASLNAQRVTVVMGGGRCSVAVGAPLVAGRVDFVVRNRSGRPRRFAIADRRTRFVLPSKAAVLRVALRAGRHRYACTAKGRPDDVRRGRLRVWAPAPARLLYASDWSGTYQVYAADPAAQLATGELTSGPAPACVPGNPCGFVEPVASPDGRRVAFSEYVVSVAGSRTLFVAAPDGTNRRPIATVDDFHLSAAWSPDSQRIAYGTRGGVWIVDVNRASAPQLVASSERAWDVAWSPDGRTLAYSASGLHVVGVDGTGHRQVTASGIPSFSWSPNGRQLAFASGGVAVADVRTGGVRALTSDLEVGEVAWSPDGRVIAYTSPSGIGLADAGTGATTALSSDHAAADTPLAWSPDGGLLAYLRATVAPTALFLGMDVRVVDRAGASRTVVPAHGRLGGLIFGVAWTRPPPNVDYRQPKPRSLASVSAAEVTAPSAITRLATDAGRVAYVSCGHVFVWTPTAGTIEQAEPAASLSPRCNGPSYLSPTALYSLAIAGDRVAFGLIGGGISRSWWLVGTTLGAGGSTFMLSQGHGTTPVQASTGYVSDLVGAGPLLVFSSVEEGSLGGPKPVRQAVVRAEPTGCPCPVLATEPGPFVPHDVESGRIAAVGDNAVVLLDAAGARLLTVTTAPATALSAQISGGDLVVSLDGELRRFDAATGALLSTWPVAAGATLQDAGRGLAAYVVDGQVRVLRLADGAHTVVAEGRIARFTDAGLVYADGNQLRLVGFDRLTTP